LIRDRTTLEAIETICDRLSERTATLFLGAGINGGVKDDAGEPFPLGQDLSRWIAKDLLEAPSLEASLEEAAEMARYRCSDETVNKYLYEEFSRFRPGTAHLALIQLPWDVIYTTNYDLLVEEAAGLIPSEAAGVVRPVSSTATDLSTYTENDILYYKLHGSIDSANTAEGWLVLTREDYRHYQLHRKPLFKRLERDLLSRTFVFIGYSLRDSNFKDILQDCRDELGSKTLPISYAVLRDFSEVEETFWREKYNIQLLNGDADEFLSTLKDTWVHQDRSVVPFEARKSKEYLQIDQATRFRKVAESFYRVRPSDCTGQSDARLFFRGGEPSWADIRDEVAPRRDAYWAVLEAMFPELSNPGLPASAYLVTGAAGTGKTTLMRAMAYELADEFIVLAHIPGTPLDTRFLAPLVDEENRQRIVLLVRHAAEHVNALGQFMDEARAKSIPITVLLEERKNQWNAASPAIRGRLALAEFTLGALSGTEIENILDALQEHNALGKLTGSPRDYQVDHFTKLATKELIVALRELTSDSSFDNIVRDEFERIPSQVAKRTYTYVAALGQLNLPVRYEILIPLLNLRADQLRSEIFRPTEGVLISGEESGGSRHTAGFNLRTRHPIIASIIFDLVASDDESKFAIVNDLLTQMDPGFPEDRRVLEYIVRGKELVDTIASHEKRRSIYERLEGILPNSSYVLVHRSILERRLNEPKLAVRFARKAVELDRYNPTALTTLGFALELEARSVDLGPRRQALISEASKLFEDVTRRDPRNAYGYVGKVNILRQMIDREEDAERRKVLQAEELSVLEEAYEATEESSIIASALADARERMGDSTTAIEVITAGLDRNPTDNRLRDLWVRLEIDNQRLAEALTVAVEGARIDPTSWRMQRHIARLKKTLGDPVDAVKGHYEAAIRHNRGNIALMSELGAYLFISGRHQEAYSVFSQANNLAVNSQERRKIRERWKDSDGNERVFSGQVKSISGASARVMAIPDNFEASFWRTRPELSDLREGDPVKFHVRFNAQGPVAHILLNT
jgi:hypothetical protein